MAEQRLAKARELAHVEAQLQTVCEGLKVAEAEVEESSKDYWKYALGIPKDAEEMADGQANIGDESLAQTILAELGDKLRPEQQQRLLDMAGQPRDQNRRRLDEQMAVPATPAKTEVDHPSG